MSPEVEETPKRTSQRTISKPATLSGVGLHTGSEATLICQPAEAGSGVVFVRTDLPDRPRIPVNVDSLATHMRRTYLTKNGGEVHTVEHLLAALNGLGIDNLTIELDNQEVPGADGSSKPFFDLLKAAGVKDLSAERDLLEVDEPVAVVEGDYSIVALPPSNGGLDISYTLDYGDAPMPIQHYNLHFSREVFEQEIAPARTFCLETEVEALRDSGLGQGANYDNTLVVSEKGVIENTLRFPDEFVRHKVLDLVGDLFLVGADLRAQIIAVKTGHSANLKLARKLVEKKKLREAAPARDGFNVTGLGIKEIQKILPHRYPLLLVDRVVELEGYRRAVGIKNVTFNEPFFSGHFPGQPVMPGVLIFESLAQLAGVLLLRKLENTGKLAVLVSLDKARVRKIVIPGDQLVLEAITVNIKSRTGQVAVKATVEDKVVAEAQMRFMLVDA